VKKEKALEDLTHLDLIEGLVSDENISDNIDVSDDYPPDKHGNSMVTMSFEGTEEQKKTGVNGIIVFTFNPQGRMVGVEVATCKKGKKDWQIATSQKFMNFQENFVGASKDIVQ